MVSGYLKVVYNLQLPVSWFTTTLDRDMVLNYLKGLQDNIKLDLLQLSHKLAMLLKFNMETMDATVFSCYFLLCQIYYAKSMTSLLPMSIIKTYALSC